MLFKSGIRSGSPVGGVALLRIASGELELSLYGLGLGLGMESLRVRLGVGLGLLRNEAVRCKAEVPPRDRVGDWQISAKPVSPRTGVLSRCTVLERVRPEWQSELEREGAAS